MDYPNDRRAGLPVTSAPMESLIKQVNARVKGTEIFWDEPAGAEAILQIRAAALCDDVRMAGSRSRSHLNHNFGNSPFSDHRDLTIAGRMPGNQQHVRTFAVRSVQNGVQELHRTWRVC